MQQDGQFTGDRYHCAFLPAFASVPSQLHAPSAQVAVDSPGPENVVRSLHQECSQVRIALFADVHLRLALSGVTPSRLQTHVAGSIPALAKTVWIFQRQHIGEGDQSPTPLICFSRSASGYLFRVMDSSRWS